MNFKDNSTESVYSNDRKHVWHSMARYSEKGKPMVVTGAEGVWIKDLEGNKYLDGMSGLWCVNVGYGREELAQVAYEQMKLMPYYPLTQSHLPAIELGEKLNEWLEGEYIFYFSNSGSEANETAFKLARQYHQQKGKASKYKFISRYRGYHGSSMGALAATGQSHRKYKYEPLVPGFLHVQPPDCYRCPFNQAKETCNLECADAVEKTIVWENEETIAGVIMEPIITGGGVLVTHDGYFKRIEEICNKYDVLFIVDEVICGFGRTGATFGFMNYDVKPDMITMAKGITSAYLPLSVTAIRSDIFETFKEQGEFEHFRHINTYGGHPAACAVATRNMDIIQREGLVDNSANQGKKLADKLSGLLENAHVGDIRSSGLLIGIEFVEDKETKTPIADGRIGKVIAECKKNGLIVGKNTDTVAGFNNILAIAPPLNINDEEIDFISKTLINAIKGI